VVLCTSAGQGLLTLQKQGITTTSSQTHIGGSTYQWEDFFNDQTKIDTGLSYNLSIDTTQGTISMANTYPAWTAYPNWIRLKPIVITNSEPSTLYQYLIDLIINYDDEMQIDFDDIRFADKDGYPLTYWIAQKTPGLSAQIYIRIPELNSGQTTIYLFYGNPTALSASDQTIFTWSESTGEDLRVSWTLTTEGAWDPHISDGNLQFLTAWEEGEGPEYTPDQSHRLIRRGIHGRLYDNNGSNPIPPYPNDFGISELSSINHAENPSIAYSEDSNKYFVIYEENPTINRWRIYIKGALVRPDGFVYSPLTISIPLQGGTQYFPCNDPSIAYDTHSNRFFIAFSKSDTTWNYNLLGKFFDPNGNQIGSQIQIGATLNYEGQPWVVSDNQGHFLVVYEEGVHATNGPFNLIAKLYDYNGNQIGNTITVATGTSSKDHIFPSVTYNPISSQYCIVWNTGDSSSGDLSGEIRAQIIDNIGNVEHDVVVQSGLVYKIPDVVPYLNDLFFVSFDDDYTDVNSIQSRIITKDGVVVNNSVELSDGLYGFEKEVANLAVSGSNIIVVWEDDRLTLNIPPTEIRASVWQCDQEMGYSTVSAVVGNEKTRILDAVLMSVIIAPDDLVEWNEFIANVTMAYGTSVAFNIYDDAGTTELMSNLNPGDSLSSLSEPAIRLHAVFNRILPTNSSILDSWGVNATVGSDIEPPWTEGTFYPDAPNGENDWYVTPINISLIAYDNDSPPENVTTFYQINSGQAMIYQPGTFIMFDVEGEDNTFEYWSEDNAGNVEDPHNVVTNLKIDYTDPFVTIEEPPDIVQPGDVSVNGTVTEYTAGSGIAQIRIRINDETVYDSSYNTSFTWFEWIFSASYGESYDIHVMAFDYAGNLGQDRRLIVCSERGIYEPGYLYLFDNPKTGPLQLLSTLNMAVAIDQDYLYVVLQQVHPNASTVVFTAHKLILDQINTFTDDDLSNGASYDLPLSSGLYELSATSYNSQGGKIGEYVIISKMLVFLL
jgi:hypothetical protein